MTEIVIASAARTPVGAFNGAFASLSAHALGTVAIKAAMERARIEGAEVDEVILGQILAAGAGQNPARQASVNAGIPVEHTAFGINQLCGSGLRAVALAAQQIATGDARIVVAGGQESMTQAPHAQQLRAGQKMGDLSLMDTMLRDGLMDAFHGYHMGNTAENVARAFQITRDEQDQFAFNSQRKAGEAMAAGRFADEIAPVTVPETTTTMPEVDLKCVTVLKCQFSYLVGADYSLLKLEFTDFSVANLQGAKFVRTNLKQTTFIRADLSNADLTGANLGSANFTGAIVTGANFTNANFTSTVICGLDLTTAIGVTQAQLDSAQMFRTKGNKYCP